MVLEVEKTHKTPVVSVIRKGCILVRTPVVDVIYFITHKWRLAQHVQILAQRTYRCGFPGPVTKANYGFTALPQRPPEGARTPFTTSRTRSQKPLLTSGTFELGAGCEGAAGGGA